MPNIFLYHLQVNLPSFYRKQSQTQVYIEIGISTRSIFTDLFPVSVTEKKFQTVCCEFHCFTVE